LPHLPALTGGPRLADNEQDWTFPVKLGVLALCLFGLPFAGFGLFALSQAIRMAHAGPGNSPFWFPLLFGGVFSSVGFGLIFAALYGGKCVQRRLTGVQANPPEG
jgi:hypothetical protein